MSRDPRLVSVAGNVLKGRNSLVRREAETSFSISDWQSAEGAEFLVKSEAEASISISDRQRAEGAEFACKR